MGVAQSVPVFQVDRADNHVPNQVFCVLLYISGLLGLISDFLPYNSWFWWIIHVCKPWSCLWGSSPCSCSSRNIPPASAESFIPSTKPQIFCSSTKSCYIQESSAKLCYISESSASSCYISCSTSSPRTTSTPRTGCN